MNRQLFNLVRTITLISVCWFSVSPPVLADPEEAPPVDSSMQAPSEAPMADAAQAPVAQAPAMTPDQLDTLVAPIALYPDQLLGQILVASTYPLELVQANQWIQQHPGLQGQELTQAAAQQSWDPSVQALVPFPDVLKRLNQDVTWTTNLGNAFLADQASVMDAVQRMRAKAREAGKLQSTPQQTVSTTDESGQTVIEIAPTNPQVIYVPVYDPAWVWGPPAYYYYPSWYYPPRPAFGWCVWGGGIFAASFYVGWHGWGGWGWHPGWRNHTVVVNNTFITQNHFNRVEVVNVRNGARSSTVWVHSPAHRMGVAYPNRALVQRYRGPSRVPVARPTVAQTQMQIHQAVARSEVRGRPAAPGRLTMGNNNVRSQVNAPANVERVGTRSINNTSYNRNRSAFGGSEQGHAAVAHGNRGRASLSRPTAAPRGGGHAAPRGGHAAAQKGNGGGQKQSAH